MSADIILDHLYKFEILSESRVSSAASRLHTVAVFPLAAFFTGAFPLVTAGAAALVFLDEVFMRVVVVTVGVTLVVLLVGKTILPPFLRTRSSGWILGITPPEAIVTCFSSCKAETDILFSQCPTGIAANLTCVHR